MTDSRKYRHLGLSFHTCNGRLKEVPAAGFVISHPKRQTHRSAGIWVCLFTPETTDSPKSRHPSWSFHSRNGKINEIQARHFAISLPKWQTQKYPRIRVCHLSSKGQQILISSPFRASSRISFEPLLKLPGRYC